MKNVYIDQIVGQGKKHCDQDSYINFEIQDELGVVKFYGVFDGHGDLGREVK